MVLRALRWDGWLLIASAALALCVLGDHRSGLINLAALLLLIAIGHRLAVAPRVDAKERR